MNFATFAGAVFALVVLIQNVFSQGLPYYLELWHPRYPRDVSDLNATSSQGSVYKRQAKDYVTPAPSSTYSTNSPGPYAFAPQPAYETQASYASTVSPAYPVTYYNPAPPSGNYRRGYTPGQADYAEGQQYPPPAAPYRNPPGTRYNTPAAYPQNKDSYLNPPAPSYKNTERPYSRQNQAYNRDESFYPPPADNYRGYNPQYPEQQKYGMAPYRSYNQQYQNDNLFGEIPLLLKLLGYLAINNEYSNPSYYPPPYPPPMYFPPPSYMTYPFGQPSDLLGMLFKLLMNVLKESYSPKQNYMQSYQEPYRQPSYQRSYSNYNNRYPDNRYPDNNNMYPDNRYPEDVYPENNYPEY